MGNAFGRYALGVENGGDIVAFVIVLFGSADEDAMNTISDLTGGRTFDGTTDSLSLIFKQIRGYQ